MIDILTRIDRLQVDTEKMAADVKDLRLAAAKAVAAPKKDGRSRPVLRRNPHQHEDRWAQVVELLPPRPEGYSKEEASAAIKRCGLDPRQFSTATRIGWFGRDRASTELGRSMAAEQRRGGDANA